jgi:DNA polymerase III epsilon subunit-like protein
MRLFPVIFDLESSFIVKGSKRAQSVIFEIGAVDTTSKRTFHSFVNPFKYTAEESLYEAVIQNKKQKVSSSLHFWHSLLFNKIATNGLTDKEIAGEIETYNAHHKVPSTQEMLDRFESFVLKASKVEAECCVIAHNGNSFDFKIIKGNANPGSFWAGENTCQYVDSYRHLSVPFYKGTGQKTGLGPLFKLIVPNTVTFNHHRALDDSLATMCAVHGMAVQYCTENPSAFRDFSGYTLLPTNAFKEPRVSRDTIAFFVHTLGIQKILKPDYSRTRRVNQQKDFKPINRHLKATFYRDIMDRSTSSKTATSAPISFFIKKDKVQCPNSRIPNSRIPASVLLKTAARTSSDAAVEESYAWKFVSNIIKTVHAPLVALYGKDLGVTIYKKAIQAVEPVNTLKNVGKVTTRKLNNLNIHTVQDLIDKRRSLHTQQAMEHYLSNENIYRSKKLAALIEEKCD